MTDSEFQSEVANLSPKIQDLLGKANGAGISTELGSLAQNLTGTSDLSAALDALKADPAKLAALEDQVASKLATPGPGSTPTSTSATAPTVPAPAPTSTPSGNSVQTSSPTSTTVVTTPSATPPPPNPWPAGRGYMWVAPAVSLAVLLGFFGMLATLLYLSTTLEPLQLPEVMRTPFRMSYLHCSELWALRSPK